MSSSLTLSITTRGIGINLSAFYADVANLLYTTNTEEPTVDLPVIYQSYRALLGLVEMRLSKIGHCRHYDHVYNYSSVNYDTDLFNIPIIFKRYLEAIYILKHKEIRYSPAMSKNIFIHGKFIPRPENIILSNLRQTVVALEASDANDDDDSTLLHRMNFYRNNPLPGAIWDINNFKLLNADEIIPENYNYDDKFRNDMYVLRSLSYKLHNFSEYINKKHANRNEIQKSLSSIICNQMGDLRVPNREPEQELKDYYRNCRPRGNIDEFYSRFKLKNKYCINDGALFLLGEYPNNESFARPIYELRSEHVNSYWYPGLSYQGSYLSYHNNIVARRLQNA